MLAIFKMFTQNGPSGFPMWAITECAYLIIVIVGKGEMWRIHYFVYYFLFKKLLFLI